MIAVAVEAGGLTTTLNAISRPNSVAELSNPIENASSRKLKASLRKAAARTSTTACGIAHQGCAPGHLSASRVRQLDGHRSRV